MVTLKQGQQCVAAFGGSVHINQCFVLIASITLSFNIEETFIRQPLCRDISRDTNILPINCATITVITANKISEPISVIRMVF
ncbi:hypothetical protein SDC9_145383 [bioreactor metagenome]|uniref:Uncharacterized protein n=1 Tax=bioreactor metagenome TaxID=1076179 RepID=A0A645E8U4_9ZZZZ